MWYPEPDPQFGEVDLGDVGYLKEGQFRFLFSVMHPADHPINQRRGVPPGFEVFQPTHSTRGERRDAITQQQLTSKSLKSVAVSAGVSAGYV